MALLALGGCTSPDDSYGDPVTAVDAATISCTATFPSGCTTAPSYSQAIAPLVQRTCNGCHAAGGVAADRDLTTYKNVARLETTELIELNSCAMPPADAGPDAMLSAAEREEILQWLICDYPNN
jgi:hypothetical protein